MQLIKLPYNVWLIGFVFFATLCSYNFHYLLANAFRGEKFVLSNLYSRLSAVLVLLAGLAGMLWFAADAKMEYPNLLIACLLTLMYSIPLLPMQAIAFTRKAGLVKTLLLAFTWTFVTAYLPLAQFELQYSTPGLLLVAKRFLFMLMLCILFDNRDIAVDRIRGFSSLATHLSPGQMKWLIYSIFALLFILNFFLGHYGITSRQVLALQLAAVINLAIYFFSLKKQGYIFYYFVVDGSMVLMTLLTTVASI